MSSLIATVAIFLGVGALGLDLYLRRQRSLRQKVGLQDRFDSEFRQLKMYSPDPRYCFDGTTARVVLERDLRGSRNNAYEFVGLERYARNEAGEYFLVFAHMDGKPYVKHVTQRMAKVALQERYIAPAT